MFNELKAAQMAAYLLSKSSGSMRFIKLLKLLYLADREAMHQTGDSMTHDRFFSLKNGPVLSQTMEFLQGRHGDKWSELIHRAGFAAQLNRSLHVNDLDELSPLNMQILDQVYGRFGAMDAFELCQWTHDNCGEWTDPGRSNKAIEPSAIFKALGCQEDEAQYLGQQYGERRELDRVMSRYD